MTNFVEHHRLISNIQLSRAHRILFMRAFINEISIWVGSIKRDKVEKLICKIDWEDVDHINAFLKTVFDSYFDVACPDVGYVEHYMTWIIGIEKTYNRYITRHFGIDEEMTGVFNI